MISRSAKRFPTPHTLFTVLAIVYGCVESVPKRGHEPWSVILCKFRDSNFEPRTTGWFKEWIGGRQNSDSIENYFYTISNGIYSIEGSNVTDWLKIPFSRNNILQQSLADPKLQLTNEKPFALYDKAKEVCINFAKENDFGMHRQKITVINQEQTAIYGKSNGVLLTPNLIFSSVLAHEMVHSMNIGHSYSDRNIQVFPYAERGEYDDKYDLMSTANAHMRPSTYGLAGPGLNGAHLDYLGWLPMNRVVYFGRDGRQNYTLRLSSLSVPHKNTNGWLLILIPYDRDDSQNVFTVEFRTPDAHDKGIGQPGVIIHQVRKIGAHYYSFLITHAQQEFNELTMDTEWVKFLHMSASGESQYVHLRVERINRKSRFADVKVISTFSPHTCLQGEFYKKIAPDDPLNKKKLAHVCLIGNRPVFPKHLEMQQRRARFFEKRRSYGQNECIDGYEWRALDAYDYVCVPHKRAKEIQVKLERKNVEKTAAKAEAVCSERLVKRSAFPNDNHCVPEIERAQIEQENRESLQFLRNPNFFNGVDTLNL
ncbi:unnamed protein product, partial [Mesorhabditis belari]|uniref:Metalloendopeptidase n=1 Tax=Mesorhabditis belari TaxID=2138241 RepID=A0AAF3FHB7_9BILA